RAITKRVAFVWSPNSANEYPFAATIPTNKTEATALDTNNNGVLDNGDDPFTPYWPGSEWVDWAGISLYWKGNPSSGTPPHDNSAPPSDYWTQMVQGGPDGSNASFPFYTMFSEKYDLPLVMSEGGAAFALFQAPSNTSLPVGAGQTTILKTFWRSYLNTTFFFTFPKAKMFMNFEFVKYDEDAVTGEDNGVTRDYRITWNSDSLAAFQSDIAALSSTLQWAVAFVAGVDPLTIGGGQTPQSGTSSSSSSSGSSASSSGTTAKSGSGGKGHMSVPTSSYCNSSNSFCVGVTASSVSGKATITVNSTNVGGWAGVSFGTSTMGGATGPAYIGWHDGSNDAVVSQRQLASHVMPTYEATVTSSTAAGAAAAGGVLQFAFDVDAAQFEGVAAVQSIYATSPSAPATPSNPASDFTQHTDHGPFVTTPAATTKSAAKSTPKSVVAVATVTAILAMLFM
ncbi:hypothetical protein HK100_007492, partial [Physocladia obscura]